MGVAGISQRHDIPDPPCRMAVRIGTSISISGRISQKFALDFEISRTGQYKYTHRPRKIERWGKILRKLNAEMDNLLSQNKPYTWSH